MDAQFHHYEQTVNGIRSHYVEEGQPDGPVILFLHGLPEGWYSWHYVLPSVDHGYRLIIPDMKGYGRSDRGDNDYDWHHVARQTVELMDSLGVQKFYLVTHDWGTIIGSVLAHDHQSRLSGFVRMEADLIRGSSRISGYLQRPQWLAFQSHFIGSWLMQDAEWFIDTVYHGGRMLTPIRQADRDYLVYEFSRPGVADKVPNYFLNSNRDLDTTIDGVCHNTFPFPVLQVQADHDPAQPPSLFADVEKRCTNVRIRWVKNASHFDNFDQPEQVAQAINDFVHGAQK